MLIIDNKHYDLADIYSPKVVKEITELLDKGIKSGEKVGIWEQVIPEMYDASIAWDESSPPDQTGVHPGKQEHIRCWRVRITAPGFWHSLRRVQLGQMR